MLELLVSNIQQTDGRLTVILTGQLPVFMRWPVFYKKIKKSSKNL